MKDLEPTLLRATFPSEPGGTGKLSLAAHARRRTLGVECRGNPLEKIVNVKGLLHVISHSESPRFLLAR